MKYCHELFENCGCTLRHAESPAKENDVHPDVKKHLAAQRKKERDLLELRQTLEKLKTHKDPDKKLIALIEADIKELDK